VRPRVAIVTNADWYFWSHRLPIARALREAGCEVLVIAGAERGYGPQIESEGFRFLPIPIARGSTRPDRELRTLGSLVGHYRRERPLLVHHVAQKAVIYGSFAARAARVPAIINAIAGQGSIVRAAGAGGVAARLVAHLAYKIAFKGDRTRAIFQNAADLDASIDAGFLPRQRAVLIRGSGVNTQLFSPMPPSNGVPTIVFAARLLWSKGLGDLVEARRRMRDEGTVVRLVIVGARDTENPECVPESALRAWETDGLIERLGERKDMPEILRAAHVVTLPSWDEGSPKVLLEAAASGRPIVATDIPGCRQIVRNGVNGLLVPTSVPTALAAALTRLVEDESMRTRMGVAGRSIAVAEFDESIVVEQTLAVYRELLGEFWP
jgi:glycosyltransferase involved in cell wall biosynthesis